MDIVSRLENFKHKIEAFDSLTEEFKIFIAINLYDFIYDNLELKSVFEYRIDYFDKLKKDNKFVKLQDEISSLIIKMLEFISLKNVKKRETDVFCNFSYNFRNTDKDVFNSLEFFNILKDPKNHYRLGGAFWYRHLEDISSRLTKTAVIREFYNKTIIRFFKTFLHDLESKNVKRLTVKYDECLEKFNEQIYRIPVKLHIKNFEDFFILCSGIDHKRNRERMPPFHVSGDKTQELKRIKKLSSDVIEDLIEDLAKNKHESRDVSLHKPSVDVVSLPDKNMVKVDIEGFISIEFTGKQQRRVIEFFHQNRDKGGWYTSKDLAGVTSARQLREYVVDINRRVDKSTGGAHGGIIKQQEKISSTAQNKYRWELFS